MNAAFKKNHFLFKMIYASWLCDTNKKEAYEPLFII